MVTKKAKKWKRSNDESRNKELNTNEIVPENVTHSSKGKETDEFIPLGEVAGHKLEKVSRILPDWLANPTIITVDLKEKLSNVNEILGLHEHLIQRLHDQRITTFFPVQREVIPVLLQDIQLSWARARDICVSAPTGSGKTLAFVLPIVQALLDRQVQAVRALVVLPVQDLAEQVYQVFQTFCEGTDLKVGLMTGKLSFPLEQQQLVRERHINVSLHQDRKYCSKVDILVSTPGRLVDHMLRTPGFNLEQLKFLVIDEADRMMDDIKHNWLNQVESAVYQDYGVSPGVFTATSTFNLQVPFQKLLFSATLSHNPEKLEQLNLFLPRLFTSTVSVTNNDIKEDKFISKYTTPAELKEYFVNCPSINKPLALLHLLHNLKYRQVICFTNSIGSTYRLFNLLTLFGDLTVQQFSSKLHTEKRSKLIKQFSSGKIDVLISTDATARGIDISNIDYVISYDKPPHIKNYIHRVGRTARAGREGVAITLLDQKENHHFRSELKEIGKTNLEELQLDEQQLNLLLPRYEKALKQLASRLQNKESKKKQKRKKMKVLFSSFSISFC